MIFRADSNSEFMADFSVALLSKLLQTSVKLCSDSDKARHNAVRAVGNLLRYLPQHTLSTYQLLCRIAAEVAWSVCLSVEHNSVPKPIVVMSETWTLVGPRNHVLGGAQTPSGKGQF